MAATRIELRICLIIEVWSEWVNPGSASGALRSRRTWARRRMWGRAWHWFGARGAWMAPRYVGYENHSASCNGTWRIRQSWWAPHPQRIKPKGYRNSQTLHWTRHPKYRSQL